MGPEGINNLEVYMFSADENGHMRNIGAIKEIKEFPDTVSESIGIKKVIFNDPATIVFWNDGTKTVVKCKEGDLFTYEMGIYAATLKKIFGATYGQYKKDVDYIIDEEITSEMERLHRKWKD